MFMNTQPEVRSVGVVKRESVWLACRHLRKCFTIVRHMVFFSYASLFVWHTMLGDGYSATYFRCQHSTDEISWDSHSTRASLHCSFMFCLQFLTLASILNPSIPRNLFLNSIQFHDTTCFSFHGPTPWFRLYGRGISQTGSCLSFSNWFNHLVFYEVLVNHLADAAGKQHAQIINV